MSGSTTLLNSLSMSISLNLVAGLKGHLETSLYQTQKMRPHILLNNASASFQILIRINPHKFAKTTPKIERFLF